MKKITTILAILVLAVCSLLAQSPEKFTYQAVVRNASNQLVSSQAVGMRISILQGGVSGTLVYMETQTAVTNANGLITLQIGGGNVQQGVFSDIDWASGPYFLKTETDPDGGSNYSITSTQQLLSVPYALYAKDAGNGFSGDYNDLTNTPAIPTVPTNVSAFTNDAGYITGYTETDPQFNAWDKDYNDLINRPTIPTIPSNVSAFTNDAGYLTSYTETDPNVPAWAKEATKPAYDYTEIANTPTIPTVPTDVSAFNNDAGYITSSDIPEIPTVPTNVSAFTNDAGYITSSDIPEIPTVPTNVSDFTNDAGYLTSYTEQQTLADVTANGNSAGNRQLKNVSDPTENLDAVNLRTLVSQMNSLQDNFQQQMQQMQQQMEQQMDQMQQQIDSLQDIVNSLDTNHHSTAGGAVVDEKSCPGTPTVTDHEGNVYATVQIGNQCWMRDNLRTTTSPSTGTYLIPAAGTTYTYTGKQAFWYNNDSTSYAPMNYGLLYNWNAAVDTFNTTYGETSVNMNENNAVSVSFSGNRRGICPAGWHLPSDGEWMEMTDYVSSQSEYTCGGSSNYIAKALASETGWYSYSGECYPGNQSVYANNATGFSAVPAGYCRGSSFYTAGNDASFWSSSQYYDGYAYDRYLNSNTAYVYRSNYFKYDGFSVRCLRDSISNGGGTSATLPTVTTSAVSNITPTAATCGGNVTDNGGTAVTVRGVCWSTSQNPTVSDSHTTDGSGTGSFTSSMTGLSEGTTYYVRAYATNSAGTAYGGEVSFTTDSISTSEPVVDAKSCPGTPTVTDHEGNVYATVQIGDQCWMRDNLRTTTSPSTGTYLIPAANADYTYTGKQARWYNNDSATYAPMNYGLLYNWNAAVDTFNTAYGETSVNTDYSKAVSVSFTGHRRGICPAGWHLPSDAEWTQMTNYVSSQSEYTCGGISDYINKALASETGWNSYSGECSPADQSVYANNATGFSAVPAGACYGSSFYYAGYSAAFWSSTQYSSDYAYRRVLSYYYANVYRDGYGKYDRFSVRCLRDNNGGGTTTQTQPTVSTLPATGITPTFATLHGTVSNPDNVTITAQGFQWKSSQDGTYTTVSATGTAMSYHLTGLAANTGYTYRAFVTTAQGTSYGAEVSFTTPNSSVVIDSKSCPAAPTVTDHEGNVYATVQIGDQCWMRENLRTTTSPTTGTYLIPAAGTNYTYSGKQARWYNNDSATYAPMNYGLLYNWNAAVDTFNTAYGETSVNTSSSNAVSVTFTGHRRGICPVGWHLPSDAEWNTMEATVSGSDWQTSYETTYDDRGNHAGKLTGGDNWNSSSTSGAPGDYSNPDRNASGFSAVPAGLCFGSSFLDAGYSATFWSSSQLSSYLAYLRALGYYCANVYRNYSAKNYGFSVRCLRD